MRMAAVTELARRLLTDEAGGDQNLPPLIAAAERAFEKLRVHLSKRIGQEGFRTLLARSLVLAKAQCPALSAVQVGADARLEGLRADKPGETNSENLERAVTLLSHFLLLLITFIGDDLTLRIIHALWPMLPLDDMTGPEEETPHE